MPHRRTSASRTHLVTILVIATCFAGCMTSLGQIPESVVEWLVSSAQPFFSSEIQDDHSDLLFLRPVIGDARIVNVGEATHGTKQILEFRHRLFRFLVEELGFRLLALEISAAGAAVVDRYICSGSADVSPQAFLTSVQLSPLLTPSGIELVKWMHDYNTSVNENEQLHIIGLDMQSPFTAMRYVRNYLTTAVPEDVAVLMRTVACFSEYEFSGWLYREDALSVNAGRPVTATLCGQSLEVLLTWLLDHEQELVAASSPWEYLQAVHCMRTVIQFEQYATRFEPRDAWYERDHYMSKNAAFFLDATGDDAKMLCWSHNAHAGLEGWGFGTDLQLLFGDSVVTMLSTFSHGESLLYFFNSNDPPGLFEPVTSRSDCLETALASVDLPRYIVDLRTLQADSDVARWFDSELRIRSAGAHTGPIRNGNMMSNWNIVGILDSTDLILYFEEVEAPRQLYGNILASADQPISETLRNGSFEFGMKDWIPIVLYEDQYSIDTVPDSGRTGSAGRLMSSPGISPYNVAIQQAVDPATYAGYRIRVSVWLQASDVSGWASLWYQLGVPSNILHGPDYRKLYSSSVSGNTIWTQQQFEIDLHSYDPPLFVGVILQGTGTVYIDDFEIEIIDP